MEYTLWVDDGNQGSYSKIESYSQEQIFVIDNTIETSLQAGLVYRIKLQAVNVIGASDFSDIA